MCYVRNVAWFLAECLTNTKAQGGTYFIADEQVLSGYDIFATMSDAIGCCNPVPLPDLLTPLLVLLPGIGQKVKFFVKSREYSISRLRSELGLVPPYEARASLAATARHWKGIKDAETSAECDAD
jgi:nucleoside-diphosphate-sugar epimerase